MALRNDGLVDAERIKADAQIRLAEPETERLAAWRSAQLEIIQAQALAQIAIDRARTEGLTTVAEQFAALQEKMSDFAQKRTALIESGALQVITDIERHYDDISDKISAARVQTQSSRAKAAITSSAAQQYFLRTQTDALKERQNSVLQSFLASKAGISD